MPISCHNHGKHINFLPVKNKGNWQPATLVSKSQVNIWIYPLKYMINILIQKQSEIQHNVTGQYGKMSIYDQVERYLCNNNRLIYIWQWWRWCFNRNGLLKSCSGWIVACNNKLWVRTTMGTGEFCLRKVLPIIKMMPYWEE